MQPYVTLQAEVGRLRKELATFKVTRNQLLERLAQAERKLKRSQDSENDLIAQVKRLEAELRKAKRPVKKEVAE